MLRSPAHRVLDGRLMLLTYRRRDGREVTIPVLHAPHRDGVVALAAEPQTKRWWRVFRSGAPATLRLRGTDVHVQGRLVPPAEAPAALRSYLARYPRAARALGIADVEDAGAIAQAAESVALVRFVVA